MTRPLTYRMSWARGAAARETRAAWVAAEAAQKERFAKMVDAAIENAK